MEIPGLPGAPAYAVSATPGHIVLGSLRGWLDPAPDLVLSGINHGANVGRAVGVSGLAVSLDVALHPTGGRHWRPRCR